MEVLDGFLASLQGLCFLFYGIVGGVLCVCYERGGMEGEGEGGRERKREEGGGRERRSSPCRKLAWLYRYQLVYCFLVAMTTNLIITDAGSLWVS